MIRPSQADFKEDFERYTNKALLLIHSRETRAAVLNILKGPDPVQQVATATVMIMQRVDAAARKEGLEIQDSVRVYGATSIVTEILEVARVAKLFNFGKELTELTLSVAMQDYVKSEVKAGRIVAEKVKVALQRDLRNLPPKLRKEAQAVQGRIIQTARKYNHGQGLAQFQQGGA